MVLMIKNVPASPYADHEDGWVWADPLLKSCKTSTNPLFDLDLDVEEPQPKDTEPTKVLMLSPSVSRVMKISSPRDDSVMVADSGSASHICPNLDMAIEGTLRPVRSGQSVKLADDRDLKIVAIGDIAIDLGQDSIVLKKVSFVPGIPYNIFSVMSFLDDGGTVSRFDCNGIMFQKDGVQMHAARERGGEFDKLCLIHSSEHETPKVLAARFLHANLRGQARVIHEHQALGHPSMGVHLAAIRSKLVMGLGHGRLYSDSDFKAAYGLNCLGCSEGKAVLNIANTPPTNGTPASKDRERLHFDIMVNIQTEAFLTGSKYNKSRFVIFMKAESSGYILSIPVPSKGEVPKHVLNAIALLKVRGFIVTAVRHDRAKEHLQQSLVDALKGMGIEPEATPEYAHTAACHIEGLINTMESKLRASMITGRMAKCLWAECLAYVTLVHNMTTMAPGKSISAFEYVHGVKPDVSRFLPLGTRVIATTPREQRVLGDKIEQRGTIATVVGMENHGYAYRLVNAKGSLTVSKDVTTITPKTMEEVLSNVQQSPTYFGHIEDEEEPVLTMPTPAQIVPPIAQPTPAGIPEDRQDQPHEEQPVQNAEEQQGPRAEGDAIPAPHFTPAAEEVKGRRGLREGPRPNYRQMLGKRQRTVLLTLMSGQSLARALKDEVRGPLWQAAAQKEYESFKSLKVFEEVHENTVPPGTKLVNPHMVLTEVIDDASGELKGVKVRCVLRGDEYHKMHQTVETTSPTASPESLRLLVSASVNPHKRMSFRFFDVRTAFLNAKLKPEEYVYMKQPNLGEGTYRPGYVWLVKGAMYGLPQAGRAWYYEFRGSLENFGWRVSVLDPCVFYKDIDVAKDIEERIYLLIHVDDGMLMGATSHEYLLDNEMERIETVYKITRSRLGEENFLGMRFRQGGDYIALDQTYFIDCLLEVFGLVDAIPVNLPADSSILELKLAEELGEQPFNGPYLNLVGGLLWLMGRTRPDIAYAVGALCRANHSPTKAHWEAAIRVLKYLKGTKDMALVFSSDGHKPAFRGSSSSFFPHQSFGYTDADYASCKVTRKSTSGVLIMGYGLIVWFSKLQEIIAQSVFESELISLQLGNNSATAVRQHAVELGLEEEGPVEMGADNQGVLKWLQTDMVSKRLKHIDIRYLRAREDVKEGRVKYTHVPSTQNVADIFTKPLPYPQFVKFREALGLRTL